MCQRVSSWRLAGFKGGDEPGDHGRRDQAGDAQRGGYVDVDDGG